MGDVNSSTPLQHNAVRWWEYFGEGRANMTRACALFAFYLAHLVTHGASDSPIADAERYHRQLTIVVGAWALMTMGVHLALTARMFPRWLKYATTTGDLMMMTLLAYLAGGPQSRPVFAFPLVIVAAGLRFHVGLVWFAALGSMACYLGLVGYSDPTWFDASHVVPPMEQLVRLLTFAFTGVFLGQIVRSARQLAVAMPRARGESVE